MYIDGMPTLSKNIVGFINSTQPEKKYKKLNFIFKCGEGNIVFVWELKTIAPREELLVDYYLHQRYTTKNLQLLITLCYSTLMYLSLKHYISWVYLDYNVAT